MKTKRYVVCPKCRAANPTEATLCWLCASGLETESAAADRPSAPDTGAAGPYRTTAERAPVGSTDTTRRAWSATLAITVLISLAITAELARVAPGLLVLFLLVDVPVLGALLRTVSSAPTVGGARAPEFVILEEAAPRVVHVTAPARAAIPPGTRTTARGEIPANAGFLERVTAIMGEGLGCIFILLAGLGLLALGLSVFVMILCSQ